MLNQIVISVIEGIEDKSITPLLAERSNGAISERGLRNRLTHATEERIIQSIDANVRRALVMEGGVKDEVDKWLLNRPKSLYAGLIYDSQAGSHQYPETLALAMQVDALSATIFEAYSSSDFKKVDCLLKAEKFLTRDYWKFGSGKSFRDTGLNSVQALNEALKTISWNCMLSILASWDVEFGSQYFQKYQPRSIFELVLPKSHVTANVRVMLWYPYRRLLSVLSCLGHFIENGKWPQALPKPKYLVQTCDVIETDLIKWRRGTKRVTYRQFTNIWEQFKTANCEVAAMPTPAYIAATFWHLSMTNQSNGERSLILAAAEYLDWWCHHRKKYEAKGGPTGVAPWPQCFTQI